jgi:hypothetical protein
MSLQTEPTSNLEKSLRVYKSFDDYVSSGAFAILSQAEMICAYEYFRIHKRLDSKAGRVRLVLDKRKSLDDEPLEDLSILQPDGSRACANWELDENGYQVLK